VGIDLDSPFPQGGLVILQPPEVRP
jgi:hypothetical protein